MKKISLLALNARYTHSNLALFSMRESIKDLDHELVILEESINENKFQILAKVIKTKAEVVAISTYIWNRDLTSFILTSLKRLFPKVIVVLGGPEAGYNSSYWMNKDYPPDYIITGAGERGWRLLAEHNFSYQERIISLPNYSFSQIELPYRETDFDSLRTKYIYYEASRGCPFECSFCLSSRSDQKLEYKDFTVIKSELSSILSYNPKIIKFVDRSFNANRQIAQSVWNLISSLDTKTKFHFEIHPDLLNNHDIAILKMIPEERLQFEIGIQSTNPATISEINRNHHFHNYQQMLTNLLKVRNIHTHLDLIVGLPLEDRKSFLNSLNDLLLLKPDVIQIGFLKVLPGTLMHERCADYEIIYDENPPYQVLQTKWLSFSDISYFLDFDEMFELIYNSGRLRHSLTFLTENSPLPVNIYIDFLDYIQDKAPISNTNWSSIFLSIKEFAIYKYPKQKEEVINDYLSWDWLLHSGKNNLPPFLDKQINHDFKKEVFRDLKQGKKDVWSELLGEDINNLNNCAFFVPQSKCFSKKMLSNKKKAIISSKKYYPC